MGFMDKVRGLGLGGGKEVAPTAAPTAPAPRADFMRGGRGVTFSGWRPALRDVDEQVSVAWDDAAARAIDVVQNSGWLSGAIDQAIANTVGTGLRLKAMPENETFGMSNADASAWGRLVEQRFELWARNPVECDIEGRRNFGQQQAAAMRTWFGYGEIFAEIAWRVRPGCRYGTKVRLVPPHRISRRSDTLARLVNGVQVDRDGFPVGYAAIRKDPYLGDQERIVPARDALGRPRVVHVFDGAIGQVRGITPLVPALQVARQFDQLADATLMQAIVAQCFAASITGDAPTEEVLQGLLTPQEQAKMAAAGKAPVEAWFEAASGWYEAATFNVGVNGRLTHLFPGQELKFHTNDLPGGNYKDFSMHLLRELARCLGLTFESATGDYQGATYSSVRMAVNEIFGITTYRRKNIASPFCQPAYEAWLEEEIETGGIPFPGGLPAFLANRTAACRAEWRGAPKPQADDLKTAKAHEVYRAMGVITDEQIANDLGVDIEDVYAQRARERQMREAYGLDEPDPLEIAAIAASAPAEPAEGRANG